MKAVGVVAPTALVYLWGNYAFQRGAGVPPRCRKPIRRMPRERQRKRQPANGLGPVKLPAFFMPAALVNCIFSSSKAKTLFLTLRLHVLQIEFVELRLQQFLVGQLGLVFGYHCRR